MKSKIRTEQTLINLLTIIKKESILKYYELEEPLLY